MSFNRFINDISAYIADLERQKKEESDQLFGGNDRVSEMEINALLEDVTDYARAHGDEPLFDKLASLKKASSNLGYQPTVTLLELKARAMRITRAIETFGGRFLEAEKLSRSPADELPTTSYDYSRVDLIIKIKVPACLWSTGTTTQCSTELKKL